MCKGTYLLMVLSILLMNCGQNKRDLSTPASRMVGHWTTEGEYLISYYSRYMNLPGNAVKDTTAIELSDGIYEIHLYIGPIDKATNKGSFIYLVRNGDDIEIQGLFEYKITKAWKKGADFLVLYWNNHGDTLVNSNFTIEKNGEKLQQLTYATTPHFNHIGDIERFILGLKEAGSPMIYKYVNNKIKPSKLTDK